MLRTFRGSCLCGLVRFEVEADLARGTTKCNCTACAKLRLWALPVAPEALRLLAGAGDLVDWAGRNPVARHPFCRRCGLHPFGWVGVPNLSGAPYWNVNLACLDDLDPAELLAAPVTLRDGRHDAWDRPPEEARHL